MKYKVFPTGVNTPGYEPLPPGTRSLNNPVPGEVPSLLKGSSQATWSGAAKNREPLKAVKPEKGGTLLPS
jgi:hypothetical protein